MVRVAVATVEAYGCIHFCMYACVYACVYMQMYIQARAIILRQRGVGRRQTDRYRNREREREGGRGRETEK